MFKQIFLKYRTNKFSKKNKAQRSTVTFEEAKTVGLLLEKVDPKDVETLNNFIYQLEEKGKKVTVFTYDNRKELPQLEVQYAVITRKDIAWNGKYKEQEVQKFIDTPFDYLISLDDTNSLPLRNIMAESKAKCRIGWYNEGKTGHLELMIKAENNISLQKKLEQMYIYTQMLKN